MIRVSKDAEDNAGVKGIAESSMAEMEKTSDTVQLKLDWCEHY